LLDEFDAPVRRWGGFGVTSDQDLLDESSKKSIRTEDDEGSARFLVRSWFGSECVAVDLSIVFELNKLVESSASEGEEGSTSEGDFGKIVMREDT